MRMLSFLGIQIRKWRSSTPWISSNNGSQKSHFPKWPPWQTVVSIWKRRFSPFAFVQIMRDHFRCPQTYKEAAHLLCRLVLTLSSLLNCECVTGCHCQGFCWFWVIIGCRYIILHGLYLFIFHGRKRPKNENKKRWGFIAKKKIRLWRLWLDKSSDN